MTGSPKGTIILMALEERNYLPECLDALLRQSCQNFLVHCLVAPDECVAEDIQAAYNGWDRRIFVHAVEEKEAPTVVSQILVQMETPYVLFLHSGDLLLEAFLETGLALAEKNSADVVICEAGLRHLRSGILRKTGAYPPEFKTAGEGSFYLKRHQRRRAECCQVSILA